MPRAVGKYKRCAKCNQIKDIVEFRKRSKCLDGLSYCCKVCDKAKDDLKRDHLRELDRQGYYRNHEKRIAHVRKYRYLKQGKDVPDEIEEILSHKKDRLSPEDAYKHELERTRLYKQIHKDIIYIKNCLYMQTDKGKLVGILRSQRRRARIHNCSGSLLRDDIALLYELQEGFCACCKSKFTKMNRYEIDHVIPVSLGGSLDINNIQLLCRSCNARKKDKAIRYIPPLAEFISYNGKERIGGLL